MSEYETLFNSWQRESERTFHSFNPLRIIEIVLAIIIAAVFLSSATANCADWKRELLSGPRRIPSGRVHFYSRAQFKYNAQLNYISRWVDTPLLLDPELIDPGVVHKRLSCATFKAMQKTLMRYGMDGFACLPGKGGSGEFYDFCAKTKIPGFTLLPEIAGSAFGGVKTYMYNNQRAEEIIIPAMRSPYALRFKGKLVVSSYGGDPQTPEFWRKYFEGYKKKYGEDIIFMPHIGRPGGVKSWNKWRTAYHEKRITQADIETVKEYYRKYLRACGGLYLPATAINVLQERSFDIDFEKNFVVKLGKEVMLEPEFKHCYFALTARVGHENCTRIGYRLSCQGTETLRLSMESALAGQPDLIIIPEWDEENENSSLRPTVCNSFAHMRIMRYYTSVAKREPLKPLPGDYTDIPNLIISNRKTLTLGERLNIELLNVPESWTQGGYSVKVILKDIKGNVARECDPVALERSELDARMISIPTEELGDYDVLIPSLKIVENGKTINFEGGLHYIKLRSTWNWDYKWVKQPLRDVLRPTKSVFKAVGSRNGLSYFHAEIASPEKLAYVELLDDNAVVYAAGKPEDESWRETDAQKVLKFTIRNMPNHSPDAKLDGTISIENAEGVKWLFDTSYTWPATYPKSINSKSYSFTNQPFGMASLNLYAAIPAKFADSAVIDINLPGWFVRKVPVKEILKSTVYGVPGIAAASMVVSRFNGQAFQPKRLREKTVSFTVGILPDMPNSTIHLRAITESGKIWRSSPIQVGNQSTAARKTVTVFSDSTLKPVEIAIPAGLTYDIKYSPDPSTGNALKTSAGRMLWGLGGGYATQVTNRGASEARDTTPFISMKHFPKGAKASAPEIVEKDGRLAWKFDTPGQHLVLPAGAIPRRAGYTLSLDVFPTNVKGEHLILSNRSHVWGSLEFYLEDGVLRARFFRDTNQLVAMDSKLRVPSNKWSKIKVVYDLRKFVFEVDGNKSAEIACEGPGRYDTPTTVGGYDTWFQGFIRDIRISQFK